MLTIADLSVEIDSPSHKASEGQEGKEVLHKVNLEIGRGEIVALTGKNGGGKSSLAQVLMGSNQYKVTGGVAMWEGTNLLEMTVDERARAGIFLAYQNPATIPGVKVFTLCKTAYEIQGNKIESVVEFKNRLEQLAKRVGLTSEHITRSVNGGFSGGERKRLELLQILLLEPKLVILDEVDSGLDQVGRELVGEIVGELSQEGVAFIVISHHSELLEQIKISKKWMMKDGRLQAGE